MLGELDEFCTKALAEHGCASVSLAVAERGELVLTKAYGLADVANQQPATPETVYGLASITKPFTATAVCLAADEGLLDLDAPLPGSYPWTAPTPRQLLQHRGGFPAFYNFHYGTGPLPRDDLPRDAVRHQGAASVPAVPDTGTLRGDLLALLATANTTRNPKAALFSSMLGGYYNQAGPTPAELREAFLSQRGSAVERGEIDPARLTPRIIALPFDLFRHEAMMTLKLVPDHVLRQIVGDIFLPLVTAQRSTR